MNKLDRQKSNAAKMSRLFHAANNLTKWPPSSSFQVY